MPFTRDERQFMIAKSVDDAGEVIDECLQEIGRRAGRVPATATRNLLLRLDGK
jgi:hypothetical protein